MNSSDHLPPEAPVFIAGLRVLTTIFTAGILIGFLLSRSQRTKIDPREPTVVTSWIPYVGHLVGMAMYGGRYIKDLGAYHRDKHIITLPVPNSRVYIVTDPSLALSIQRSTKMLSFTPIIPEVTKRILGLDKETYDIASKHLDPGPGEERGFLADIQDMVKKELGPGNYLNRLSLRAARDLREEVRSWRAELERFDPSVAIIDLLDLVRRLVTNSTARYLYGPRNPIALDPSLKQAFWDFDHGLGALLVNVLPQLTARKAYQGRERLASALADYIEAGEHNAKNSSDIVRRRVQIALEHGWKPRAIARSELSFLFAGIVNATTSTFWILLQIFADPSLLAEVRNEIANITKTRIVDPKLPDSDVRITAAVLNLQDLASERYCPTLMAVYNECLRLNSNNNSVRFVKESTILNDRYFLAKGSVVQIAGGVIHGDPSLWGPDPHTFNPDRFRSGHCSSRDAAFRAFGGGKTLCPGRQFATYEILSLVASMVLQFDMEAPDGGERTIDVPPNNDTVLPVHILEPVRPVRKAIRPRDEWDDGDKSVRVLDFVLEKGEGA